RPRPPTPRYAALTQPEPPTLDEIRGRVLDEDTVLLEFSVSAESSTLWAVTRDGLLSQRLPGAAQIDGAVRNLTAALTERQRRMTAAALERSDAGVAPGARRPGAVRP